MRKKASKELITKLEAEYLEPFQKWSLSELGGAFEVETDSLRGITELEKCISKHIFENMIRNEEILNLEILEHFVSPEDSTHYFAIAVLDTPYCYETDRNYIVYRTIRVGHDSDNYGFENVLDNMLPIVDSCFYQTVRDILPLLEKYTDILDFPLD